MQPSSVRALCFRSKLCAGLALVLLSGAVTVSGSESGPPVPEIDVQRLSPRVAILRGGDPWDTAVIALSTPKGLVVVDAPFSPSIAERFRKAIEAEFARRDFAFLINSHEHSDHVGGNRVYGDLPIIGHASVRAEIAKLMADSEALAKRLALPNAELAEVRKRLEKTAPERLTSPEFLAYERAWKMVVSDYQSDPSFRPPTVTFDRELTLHLGELTVRLVYCGGAHSVGDTLISIPEEKLVLTESMFSPGQLPHFGERSAEASPRTVENWLAVLGGVLRDTADDTRFVASHARAFLTRGEVQRSLAYLDKLWADVRHAQAAGTTLDRARTELALGSRFPEVAGLRNDALAGTMWEVRNIHERNLEFMWKAAQAGRTAY